MSRATARQQAQLDSYLAARKVEAELLRRIAVRRAIDRACVWLLGVFLVAGSVIALGLGAWAAVQLVQGRVG